jgi:D-alanyl-D-alanine dipeptidase
MKMRFFILAGPVLLLAPLAGAGTGLPAFTTPQPPRQMILVVTKDWQAVGGRLQRFELNSNLWQAVGPSIQIVVGRNGMGWGAGVHPMPEPGPQKKEGDRKSPAGAFQLPATFGYAPLEKMGALKMPYTQCTGTLECVDDPKSASYNRVLERSSVPKPDWASSEKMRMSNGQYRLGVVIEHNTSPPVPGGGSCVFMHIWLGPEHGTTGCTAMSESDIETVLAWLDAQAHPILVQLPQPEYARLREAWHLPEMPPSAIGAK